MQDYLNVKEGDKVLCIGNYRNHLLTITKITPSGNIRASDGRLFNPYGKPKGGSRWNYDYLEEYMGEAKEKYIHECAIQKAFSLMKDCQKISYEQAVEIIKILKGNDNAR